MNFVRRRRAVLLLAVVLLALFIVRPGANGLRKRIVNTVSLSLGRRVEVQWVKLRMLPQPGFDLVNFVVQDDAGFSAEPVLRAQEVTATLRLRSLLRGRMEIGRLSLKEPSFNLVRGENGHWNIESLIERAAHTTSTTGARSERRPVFPYIEGDNGRINFKIGLEKKAYSLTDADFSLWLDSDDQWGIRLAAQPVRTDFNLSDTGTLRLSGAWKRSDAMRNTPVQFTFRWDGAQMGELTKLIYGKDLGWRGALSIASDMEGTPANLKIAVKSSLIDFRRYDIVDQHSMRLATSCQAQYSSVERAISNLVCQSPIGSGTVTVTGRIGAPTGPRTYDVQVAADNVPMQAVVNLARKAKKNLPDDLLAAGSLSANFALQTVSIASPPEWSGAGRAQHVALRSSSINTDLATETIPFSVQSSPKPTGKKRASALKSEAPRLSLGPFTVALGKQSSLAVHGSVDRSGYNLAVQGEGSIGRLTQTAQALGLQVPQMSADGAANLDLTIAGPWSGFAPASPTGTIQLRSVHAQVPGLKGGIEIKSARLMLEQDTARVESITASFGGAAWDGSLSFPRPCHLLSGCPVHVDLHSESVAADRFHQWLSPSSRKQPWYRFAATSTNTSSLLTVLNAEGTVTVDRVQIRNTSLNRVSSNVEMHDGVLRLTELRADVLGGRHTGSWTGNLHVNPPEFQGTGNFEHVALAQLANVMHDTWIDGTAKASYQFSTTGRTLQEWLASARGNLRFDMRNGSLPHIVVPSSTEGLRVRHFSGRLAFEDGNFSVEEGRLESASATYIVSGTAQPGQLLKIKLAHSNGGFLIDGTLSAPHVVSINAPDTRASLKP